MKNSQLFILLISMSIVYAEGYQALTESLEPYNYSENDTLKGISVEIVEELFQRVDMELNIMMYPWARAYNTALYAEKTILFSTVRTPEREEQFNWVGPLYNDTIFFYQKRSNPLVINTLDDARNVSRILAVRKFPEVTILQKNGFDNMELTNSQKNSMLMLNEERADLMIVGSSVAQAIAEDIGIYYSTLQQGIALAEMDLYIALSKDIPQEIVLLWQKTVDEIKADGTYDAIVTKYMNPEE